MMAQTRQMHLASFIFAGMFSQSWRHPSVQSDGEFSLPYMIDFAQTAERGMFDCVFMADESSLARPGHETDMLQRLSSVTGFDPLTLMTALAMRTEKVGLVFTASTTYAEPYNLARSVASLDHISGGRAGWNLVTSANALEAPNFGREVAAHADRYARAREFYEAVTGLWDSFDDDAFVLDKERGVYARPDAIHTLDYQGRYFQVKGPLKMGRPPQGYPIVAQAGASEDGRALGAQTADVIFCTNHFISEAQAFYADIKGRAIRAGRRSSDVAILPGTSIIWGETDAEAEDRFAAISDVYPLDIAIQNITGALGIDVSHMSPDDLFPTAPSATGHQGHFRAIAEFARRGNLTIRQTAQRLAASSKHRMLFGSTKTIADNLEEWFTADACDGFVVMSPYRLEGFRDVVRHVVPELQRRGLFRTRYEGSTLRDHLGLSRPPNRHIAAAQLVAAAG